MTHNPHAYAKTQDCSKKCALVTKNTKSYLCFYNLLLPAHFVFLGSGRQASTILPPSMPLSSWPSLPLRKLPWYCHCVHEVLVNHDIQVSKLFLPPQTEIALSDTLCCDIQVGTNQQYLSRKIKEGKI